MDLNRENLQRVVAILFR